jgi:16S rRNA (adenine1518-N6/adenine1519-N6)-dimethyltransferase
MQQLQRLEHQPRKALGQNFLVDKNIVSKSLELAELLPGATVVEVGPGLGTLTSALLEAGCCVWAIEYDRTLFEHLSGQYAGEPRLHLSHGDAVQVPLAHCVPALEGGCHSPQMGAFKIVANLPYAIATPWLDQVLEGPLPQCLVLMLQKECAERFCAPVGSKRYGAISVLLEAAYMRQPGHAVARQCFHPVPDVDSVLLKLVRRPQPKQMGPAARQCLRQCFTQRRKQISSIVGRLPERFSGAQLWLEHAQSQGLSLQARPEAIPAELWWQLDTFLGPVKEPSSGP